MRRLMIKSCHSAYDPIADLLSSLDNSSMRFAFAILLIAFMTGCAGEQAPTRIDRIEMRNSGWTSVDVQINRRSEGQYQMSLDPGKKKGSFSVSPGQFTALVKRLRPFQEQAVPLNHESMRKILDFRCPEGVPDVTDHGGFWIRWVGPNYDRHYSVDFGCDYERNRVRNNQLRSLLKDFPIPARL